MFLSDYLSVRALTSAEILYLKSSFWHAGKSSEDVAQFIGSRSSGQGQGHRNTKRVLFAGGRPSNERQPTVIIIYGDHLILCDGDGLFEDCPDNTLVARRSCQTSVVSVIVGRVAWKQIVQRKRLHGIHLFRYTTTHII